MKYSKKAVFTIVFAALCMTTSLFAQKFGHINSQLLLMGSPLVKVADSELKVYQDELMNTGQAMVSKFEEGYKAYVAQVDNGSLSKVQMEKREGELAKSQEAIQKYEIEVQQKIAKKREELYAPILEKAKLAIDEVGKEGSFTMIFDTSSNGVVFAPDSEDLLAQVKAKLAW